jgi:hypothetical protein
LCSGINGCGLSHAIEPSGAMCRGECEHGGNNHEDGGVWICGDGMNYKRLTALVGLINRFPRLANTRRIRWQL